MGPPFLPYSHHLDFQYIVRIFRHSKGLPGGSRIYLFGSGGCALRAQPTIPLHPQGTGERIPPPRYASPLLSPASSFLLSALRLQQGKEICLWRRSPFSLAQVPLCTAPVCFLSGVLRRWNVVECRFASQVPRTFSDLRHRQTSADWRTVTFCC